MLNFAEDTVTQSETTPWVLTILNPCVDPAFVAITAPSLDNYEHIVSSGSDLKPQHNGFTFTFNPTSHDMCGPAADIVRTAGLLGMLPGVRLRAHCVLVTMSTSLAR